MWCTVPGGLEGGSSSKGSKPLMAVQGKNVPITDPSTAILSAEVYGTSSGWGAQWPHVEPPQA